MPENNNNNLLVLFLTSAYTVALGAIWLWTCWS